MPDIWSQSAILLKLCLYISVLGASGLVMVRMAFGGATASIAARLRNQTLVLALVALVVSVLGFMLRGAALTGGVEGMVDPEMLDLLWQTPVGDALLYRILGGALLIGGVLLPRFGQWIALAGGGMLLWSFAQIGHVTDLEQKAVHLLLLLHLFGIAFWIGVLPPLHRLSALPDHRDQAAELGHQFSRAAMIVVPALLLAGLVMGFLLTGSLAALLGTGYGQALLLKSAFVAVVLALAAANKLHFVPAMQAGEANAARHLAHSIKLETAVILLVLAITATLTSVLTLPN